MTDFTKVQQALERRGYTVRTFAAANFATEIKQSQFLKLKML